MKWPFNDDEATIAVTSSDVADRILPILYASHETDDGGETVWQFHNDPNRFDLSTALLVRLDTMLAVDESISDLGTLPVGWQATRTSESDIWQLSVMQP